MTKCFFVFVFSFLSFSQQSLLQEFGKAPSADLKISGTYTLRTWNIYKGGMDGLYDDLQKMVQSADFVLLQEFLLNTEQKKLIETYTHTHWAFAKSFMSGGEWTGVATMSQWQPYESVAVRSPGAEPFAGTPKMSLITKYQIQNKELWLVNLHGLNFNIGHGAFKEQIDDIVQKISAHQGPMIFAGDFNTWAESRLEYLLDKTQKLGLMRADIESPMGLFNKTLDHIFFRGLQSVEYRWMSEYSSSDHVPLEIRFEL